MRGLDNGLAVYKRDPLIWSEDLWVLDCHWCSDDMEFGSWADAQAGAMSHVAKHRRSGCPTCGHFPPIRRSEWP